MNNPMKFTLVALITILSACGNDAPPPKKQSINPNAFISIRPQAGGTKAIYDGTTSYQDSINKIFSLSATEICWHYRWSDRYGNRNDIDGIHKSWIDYTNQKFMWIGDQVVYEDYETKEYLIGPWALDKHNIVLCYYNRAVRPVEYDTIGYIPNAVVLDTREKITQAFNEGDYETCYRLFDEAYIFIPITGAAYRELVRTGQEIVIQ